MRVLLGAEEGSPGDSTSGSFEQPLQRVKGTAQYGCDFGKGGWGRWNQALFFFKKDFSVFLDIRRHKNWAHKTGS